MKVRNKRLAKSPFILAAASGGIAIVLDFIWSLSEVLKASGVADIVLETHIALLTLFPLCLALLALSVRKYIRNGYMRKENNQELKFKKHIIRQEKLKKVLK